MHWVSLGLLMLKLVTGGPYDWIRFRTPDDHKKSGVGPCESV